MQINLISTVCSSKIWLWLFLRTMSLLFSCSKWSLIVVLPSWNWVYKAAVSCCQTEIHLSSGEASVSSQMSSRPPWAFNKKGETPRTHTHSYLTALLPLTVLGRQGVYLCEEPVDCVCEFGIENKCNPVLIKSERSLPTWAYTWTRSVCLCVCVGQTDRIQVGCLYNNMGLLAN